MKVEVYRNLRNNKYSIKALDGPEKGKVIEYAKSLVIFNPSFVVQPAGRDKVRKVKQKNVHAFVRGRLASKTEEDFWRSHVDFTWDGAYYDPYDNDTWIDGCMNPIKSARIAVLDFIGDHSRIQWF